MLFLILLIILLIVSTVVSSERGDVDIVWHVATITNLICIGCLILIPVSRISCMDRVQEIKSIEKAIIVSREKADETERAALYMKIVEANAFIDKAKFFNKNFFLDIYIPDECCKMDYLK
jgi:hypothetical protein